MASKQNSAHVIQQADNQLQALTEADNNFSTCIGLVIFKIYTLFLIRNTIIAEKQWGLIEAMCLCCILCRQTDTCA